MNKINIQTNTKAIRYPVKSYRLNPKTIEQINRIKRNSGLSYNLVMLKLINTYMDWAIKNKM